MAPTCQFVAPCPTGGPRGSSCANRSRQRQPRSNRNPKRFAVNTGQLTLLRPVSRSFYISIRVLPRTLREPVALAYLLARTTDTIADTDAIDVDLRIRMLQVLADAIQGDANGIVSELKQTFAPLQKNEAERNLIESVELSLRGLARLTAQDRTDVRVLLKTITRGQLLDLTRWRSGLAALANSEELREYAYLVAGCVGEFWTCLCFRRIIPSRFDRHVYGLLLHCRH